MSREIKFRVWDKENKKMYRSPYDSDFNIAITLPNLVDYYPKSETARANFHTYHKDGGCSDFQTLISRRFDFMLFIGRTDKNNKQVYNPPKYQLKTLDGNFVDFESGDTGNFEKYYKLFELEIIGNLYENPDLLTPTKGERG
jgi:hypothetical protein